MANNFLRGLGWALRRPGEFFSTLQTVSELKKRDDHALPGGGLMAWPMNYWGSPNWSILDYSNYVEEGYSFNSVIYSAINYKARAQATAHLRVMQGERDEAITVPDNHPLAQLTRYPNRYQSWREFVMSIAYSFNIAGNALVYLARDKSSPLPVAMYVLRPDWVYLMPGAPSENLIVSYVYTPRGVSLKDGSPIPPDDIIHVKLPNPGDELHGAGMGLSPFAPVSRPANVDNDVTRFLKVFFEKGAMFQNVISYDNPINQTRADEARERLEEIYGGAENWHKFAVLGDGARVNRLTPTFDEMGFEAIDERNETRILGPFGVPPILIGTRVGLMRSTYSNYDEARRQCWEDTLLPELRLIEDQFNRSLAYDDVFLRFDVSDIPALQRNMVDLTTAAGNLMDRGVPPRVAFDTVGLDVPAYDGDSVGYLNTIPVSSLPGESLPELQSAGNDEQRGLIPPARKWGQADALLKTEATDGNQKKTPNHRKMNIKINAVAESFEAQFERLAKEAFAEEYRNLELISRKENNKSRQEVRSIDWNRLAFLFDQYYKEDARENWNAKFRAAIREVVQASAMTWATELGREFDPSVLFSETWYLEYILKFSNPITETSSAFLASFLEQAKDDGWGIDKMTKHMGMIFDQWADGKLDPDDFYWLEQRMPVYRRELIARTETIRASNAGSMGAGARMGVDRKVWIATFDGRQRETHEQADLDYREGGMVGPIPMTQAFMVGGYPMQFPGDPSGPIEEFANCRCTVSFVFDD